MKRWWIAFKQDVNADLSMEGGRWLDAALSVLRWRIRQWVADAYCARFGHDTEAEADAESGYESVSCRRCGWGFTCFH